MCYRIAGACGVSPYGLTLRELWWMKEGLAEFWGAAMFGGPSSKPEKMDYNPAYLQTLVSSGRVVGVDE